VTVLTSIPGCHLLFCLTNSVYADRAFAPITAPDSILGKPKHRISASDFGIPTVNSGRLRLVRESAAKAPKRASRSVSADLIDTTDIYY
jgi:hypothetical protein